MRKKTALVLFCLSTSTASFANCWRECVLGACVKICDVENPERAINSLDNDISRFFEDAQDRMKSFDSALSSDLKTFFKEFIVKPANWMAPLPGTPAFNTLVVELDRVYSQIQGRDNMKQRAKERVERKLQEKIAQAVDEKKKQSAQFETEMRNRKIQQGTDRAREYEVDRIEMLLQLKPDANDPIGKITEEEFQSFLDCVTESPLEDVQRCLMDFTTLLDEKYIKLRNSIN